MNIGIDMDGVLAPFDASFSDLLVKVTGKNRFPHLPYEPPCWEWATGLGYTREEEGKAWDYIANSNLFWEQLGAYPYSRALLEALKRAERGGNRVTFVTNRMGLDPKGQTERWLQRHGYGRPQVMIAADKGAAAEQLDLDWYADDKTENCEATRDICYTLVVARPWNREVDGCVRVKPEELERYVDGL